MPVRTQPRPASSTFGHAVKLVDDAVIQHPAASQRIADLFAAWGCSDNHYNRTLDVRPFPGVAHIAQAEWLADLAGRPCIERGYLVRVVYAASSSDQPASLYHATTLAGARERLRSERRSQLPDRLPRIFARCRFVTMAMVRRMGWCEPGIRAWWSQHLKRPFVPTMGVADVWAVCQEITVAERDFYTTKLIDLLQENPLVGNPAKGVLMAG